ncbi:hypothetical protein H2200_008202 [Cladophialophora chaetospira]|uniref:Uncharacterized protein n=1 Tax=Cladophialophora chaetospira TaxID=386627 RepID=A0AA38X5B5_9EURO|nr:hypothetical protein H2200_008202 [Cladophialophora chaetospira]
MASQIQRLRESAKEARHTDSHDNTFAPESDVDREDRTDAVLQPEPGDEQALDGFIQSHPPPPAAALPPRTSDGHLPYPVVIPQRRPGNKSRGFVEAYAPVLEQFGIQQDEFTSFIRAANKAVRASKLLTASQLAAVGTSFVPNSIALGASVAVQVVAGVIAMAEGRWKANSFLDRVNEEYFRPRGLYCLLMTYTPFALGAKEQFDIDEAVSGAPSPSLSTKEQSFVERARKNLRNPVAGTVEGEERLPPNVAPLVHPAVSAATQDSPRLAKQRNAITRITNYLDDRAQARYVSIFSVPALRVSGDTWRPLRLIIVLQAKESKGDILSQPSPPSFKNRYLDPTHSATNGGLLGLVSGGRLTPNAEKANQRMQASLQAQTQAVQEQQSAMMESLRQQLTQMDLPQEQEQAYIKQYEDAFQLQEQQLSQQSKLVKNGAGQVRRIWNVSYLMIVEIPSNERIATARGTLEASGGRQLGLEVAMTTVNI